MITTVRIDKRIESEWLNSYQFPALVLYCGINLQFLKQCNVYFYNVEFQVLGRPIVFCCVFFCVCFYCITCLVSLPCCKRKLLSGGTDSGADWGIQLHSSLLSNTRCSIYRWGEGGGFQGSTGLVETGSPHSLSSSRCSREFLPHTQGIQGSWFGTGPGNLFTKTNVNSKASTRRTRSLQSQAFTNMSYSVFQRRVAQRACLMKRPANKVMNHRWVINCRCVGEGESPTWAPPRQGDSTAREKAKAKPKYL